MSDTLDIPVNTPINRRRRTEDLGVVFKDGIAEDWFFGVPTVFREAMDIRCLPYVDREATRKLRKEKGTTKDENGALYRVLTSRWTRGIPPSRSFKEGDCFYRPAEVREMVWGEALKILTHLLTVKDAQSDNDDGTGGWVEFEWTVYGHSKTTHRQKMTQAEFEDFLRFGPSE